MKMKKVVVSILGVILVGFTLAGQPEPAANLVELGKLQDADLPIRLQFPGNSPHKVFRVIEEAANIRIVLDEVDPDMEITAVWETMPLKDALLRLAKEYNLLYEVTEPTVLIVRQGDAEE